MRNGNHGRGTARHQSIEISTQALQTYRDFNAKAPRELTSVAILRTAPPAPWLPQEIHGKPIVAIFVWHFLNEDEGRERIESAYSASNLARLAELKEQYDPQGLFRHTKSVVD